MRADTRHQGDANKHQHRRKQKRRAGRKDRGARCGEHGKGIGHDEGGSNHRQRIQRRQNALNLALGIGGRVARNERLQRRRHDPAQGCDRCDCERQNRRRDKPKRTQRHHIDPHPQIGCLCLAKTADQGADKQSLPRRKTDTIKRQRYPDHRGGPPEPGMPVISPDSRIDVHRNAKDQEYQKWQAQLAQARHRHQRAKRIGP